MIFTSFSKIKMQQTKLLIIILSISPVYLYLFQLKINENYETSLGKMTANIFLNECFNCKTVLIIHMEDDDTVNIFLNEISTSKNYDIGIYTIKLTNFTSDLINYPTNYVQDITIIFLNENNWNNTEELIFNIETESFWKIRTRYLLVATGAHKSEDDEWVFNSFKRFWERQALRVLICFWKNGPKIFGYNPFLGNFGYDVTNRRDIAKIFTHKITNMNGHPIKLYHLDCVFKDRISKVMKNGKETWTGMDGKFFGTVSEWLNATLIVHPITDDFPAAIVNSADHNIPMRDFVKALTDIYDFDSMANAGRTYEDNELDHVFLYDRNDMFIVLPRGKLIPRYLYIFLIVPVDVWCCTLSSLFVVSVIMICIKRYRLQKADVIETFINNYRLLLNESVPDTEGNPQERFLTIIWIIHCIVVATLFQSVLTTTLVAPKYYPDINTLEDLYKTDLKIHVAHFSLVHLSRGLAEENKQFLNHLVEVPKDITVYGETIDWIEMYRYNSGVLVSTEQVYYLKINSKNVLRPNFHVMTDSIMPNVQAYNVINEKLFYEEFLQAMGIIRQAGLYHHWRKYNYDFNMKSIYNFTENYEDNIDFRDNDEKGLTMEHLQAGFLLLIFGNFISGFVFLFENFYKRVSKN